MESFHSEGRQISQLPKIVPDPEVEIHPDTAKEANIRTGDWIWIEPPKLNKGERIKFKAKLTPNTDPRVVHALHGWWFPEKPGPGSTSNFVMEDKKAHLIL